MEAFFWSLLVAALSGLTWLAYQHPGSFKARIAMPLIKLTSLIILGIVSYSLGSMSTYTGELTSLVEQDNLNKEMVKFAAKGVENAFRVQVTAWIVGIVFIVYLLFLVYLPILLDEGRSRASVGD